MPDRWIIEMSRKHGMIEPFSETQVRQGISYGPSSYGYDISLAEDFKVLDTTSLAVIDPKADMSEHYRDITAKSILIPPNSFVLGRTREYFRVPRDILIICLGKSTYARCGVIINVTPLEPEWEGYVTMCIANTSPLPVRLHAGEGIAQVLFLQASEQCEVSYKDKKGRYQAQQAITLSRMDESVEEEDK
jgi:dCTP deaminase